MYLMYLDESGKGKKYKHFILAGLVLSSESWQELNAQITDLKLRYFGTVYVDLKGLRYVRSEYLDKSRKVKNPFHFMPLEEYNNFKRDIVSFIKGAKFTYFAAIINKRELKKQYGDNSYGSYYLAYKFLVERFQKFLEKREKQGLINIESGDVGTAKSLEKAHQRFLQEGTELVKIKNIIESCHFLAGPRNNFIQLADLFAGALFSKYEYDRDEYFKTYEDLLDKDEKGNYLGWGIKYFP